MLYSTKAISNLQLGKLSLVTNSIFPKTQLYTILLYKEKMCISFAKTSLSGSLIYLLVPKDLK